MNILDVFLIGIALAMDAFALTISNCTTYKETLNRKKEWSMPICFALFQGIMPLIGYYVGSLFYKYIEGFIGYITAGIFFLLALKIVIDVIKENRQEKLGKEKTPSPFTFWLLILQGIATSIDALAVGITLTASSFSIFISIAIISAVTFLIVALALLFGKFLGAKLGNYATWVGAGLLLALAIKSLVEAII